LQNVSRQATSCETPVRVAKKKEPPVLVRLPEAIEHVDATNLLDIEKLAQ
jgi:hypothetical protein